MSTARRYQRMLTAAERDDPIPELRAYWANPEPFEAERRIRQAELNAQIDAAVRRANPHPWEREAEAEAAPRTHGRIAVVSDLHTRGPWRVRVNPGHDAERCDLTICGDIWQLADINGPQYEHQEANAYLMAAAPDMLDALRAFVERYDAANPMRLADCHPAACACMRCTRDQAEAAIAKARSLSKEIGDA